jgi:hypothetical protein
MRTLWTAVLVLTVAHPAPAQLREVRPARTAFAVGWSDVTGYGTAIAALERFPRAPLGVGIAVGAGGIGGHAQIQVPNPFRPPRYRDEPFESVMYLSGGVARLFGRDAPGMSPVEWAVMIGGEVWPRVKPWLFVDLGFGFVGPIGGAAPGGRLGGLAFRFLVGWAF